MQSIKPNFLDRAISVFSPRAGYDRLQYRQALARFDGATHTHRGKMWNNAVVGPATQTMMGLDTLRSRSRDMVRNNPWALKATNVLVGNIVGTGIVGAIKNNDFADDLWKEWSQETTHASSDDMHDFAAVQDLAVRSVIDGGECFIRRRWRRKNDGYTIPFQLELMESEFLDASKNETLGNGNKIVQGVEFNALNKRVAYWFFTSHPDDMTSFTSFESRRVKAKDIIHLYRVDRIGQVRGVPWIAPVMLRMKDFEGYEDAHLMAAKIASCFVGTVETDPVAGAGPSAQNANNQPPVPSKFVPGSIFQMPAGKTMKFNSPPRVDGFGAYSANQLRSFSAGYGITYEDLTGDYSGFNFSSARMSRGAMFKNIDRWQKSLLIQRLCQHVGEWFSEALALTSEHKGQIKFRWTPPRREMVDPAKEISVIIKMVRGGLCSLTTAITSLGYDPKDVLEQIKQDNELLDQLSLVLDSDPRRVSLAGVTQSANPFETESETENE